MIKNIATESDSTISRLSTAKINLFLHITGRRADGYHNLQTVFRLLDWGDYLHFSVVDDAVVTVDSELDANTLCHKLLVLDGAETISANIEDNLIFKAARALLAFAIQSETLPKQLAPVTVTLDKHLPMGAGLGGGSSNAATTMLVLNHLQALDPSNLSYQLSYAQLLLANERSSDQGLALATSIIQIRYDDPRYDNDLHLQALNVLASNALAQENYKQVIDYLQTPYDVLPTLRSGSLLLRAYQGLGDNAKVETLLADLQQRFSYGQHNINDRIQLY